MCRAGPYGEPPTIVLDAGTGLQQLSLGLGGEPFCGTILLGHLHWDHTHGMPFFRSGLIPGHRVDLYLPEQGVDAEELLARAISPPHFRSARAAGRRLDLQCPRHPGH